MSDRSARPARTRFTRAELESFRDAEVPDLLPEPGRLRLLFVGINPGLWTAATRTHFAHPVNRFYPALLRAGIIEHPIDPANGMTDEDRERLRARGIGITNVVPRATAKASELSREELRVGGERLVETIRRHRPAVVAIAGITGDPAAFGLAKAKVRRQARAVGDGRLLVGPEPSGLNAHETVASLAEAYAAPARAAGVLPD